MIDKNNPEPIFISESIFSSNGKTIYLSFENTDAFN